MKAMLSVEEIHRIAQAMRDRIKALKISYQYTSAPTEAQKPMSSFTPVREQRRTFAIRGPLRSSEIDGLQSGERIYERYVLDGKHIAYEIHDRFSPRIARMDGEFAMRSIDQRHPYCLMMDLQLSDKQFNGSWNFPWIISNKNFPYRVREEQEKIGGRWCHVLEHPPHAPQRIEEIGDGEQVDYIWVDSDNPGIMVKRESCFTCDGEIFPFYRIMFRNIRDVGEGVWIPERLDWECYPLPTDKEQIQMGVLISNASCTVTEVKLNDQVKDENFDFCVAKGEILGFCSVGPVVNGLSAPIYPVFTASDTEQTIAMPLDQASNEEIKRIIAEKDLLFFQ